MRDIAFVTQLIIMPAPQPFRCRSRAQFLNSGYSETSGHCHVTIAWSAQQSYAAAELLLSPVKALVAGCSAVAAGAEFTVWLCEGKLYSAGCPQYGQLGHGTDHEYNAKDCAWPSPCS